MTEKKYYVSNRYPEKLEDTIEDMLSSNYKDRFRAEYEQLSLRIRSLENMLEKWAEGSLNFTPTCPWDVLMTQRNTMYAYKSILDYRAKLEGIQVPRLTKLYEDGTIETVEGGIC